MIARSRGFKTLGDFIEQDVRNSVEKKGHSLTRRYEGDVKQRFGVNINDSVVDLEVTRQREEPLRAMILNWFHGDRKVPDDADLAARIIVSIVEQSRLMADELEDYMVTSTDKMIRRDLHNELVNRVERDFPDHKIYIWRTSNRIFSIKNGQSLFPYYRKGWKLLRDNFSHYLKHSGANLFSVMDHDLLFETLNEWKQNVTEKLPEDHKQPDIRELMIHERRKRSRRMGTAKKGRRLVTRRGPPQRIEKEEE